MGGAQPLAGTMAGAAILTVEVNQKSIDKRLKNGFLQHQARDLEHALSLIRDAQTNRQPVSVGLLGNAADVFPAILAKGIIPDIVTDQTAAHDLVYGYVPSGYSRSRSPPSAKRTSTF